MDEFVYPNLTNPAAAFIDFSTLMQLMTELQADNVSIPFMQLTLLLEVMMPFLTNTENDDNDAQIIIEENYEVVNQCVRKLVNSLRVICENCNKSGEKETAIYSTKQLIEEHGKCN